MLFIISGIFSLAEEGPIFPGDNSQGYYKFSYPAVTDGPDNVLIFSWMILQ